MTLPGETQKKTPVISSSSRNSLDILFLASTAAALFIGVDKSSTLLSDNSSLLGVIDLILRGYKKLIDLSKMFLLGNLTFAV